jgi:pilus assembly protein CpaC
MDHTYIVPSVNKLRKYFVCAMIFCLLPSDSFLWAATPAKKKKAIPGAKPPIAAHIPEKEPLIEVSVDSLEISENNSNTLGVLWGYNNTTGSGGSTFVNNQVNVFENAVPALFKVGELSRSALAAQLDALIEHDQARVLANPTLLTKSGFEANFLVGGEIPYPTVGQGGAVGVEFKKYGVALKILPAITPRNTIDAQITIGVSNPDNSQTLTIGGVTVPGIASRETSSKVEVKSGETVVLAGIKQSNRSKATVRVPILGYIPLLGLLFRHSKEIVTETSLVLFVTFRLIK